MKSVVQLAKMKSVDKSEQKSNVVNPVKKTDVNTVLDQAALQQILTKMDAQFLEIKETLYVRVQCCGLKIDCSATFTLVTHILYTHLRIAAYVKCHYSLYVRTFSFAKSGAIGMMKNIQNFIFHRVR